MKCAGETLTKERFDKLLHIRCLSHNLHRVAVEIHKQPAYADLKKLVEEMKQFFCKSGRRRRLFREFVAEKSYNVKIPVLPCVTRWGTYIRSAEYFAKDQNRKALLEFMKEYIEDNARKETQSAKRIEQLLSQPDAGNQAHLVHSLYNIIPEKIRQFEKRVTGK